MAALRTSRSTPRRAAPTGSCCEDGVLDRRGFGIARPVSTRRPRSGSTWPCAPGSGGPHPQLEEGEARAQPACRAEPTVGRPAHHRTTAAGRPCPARPERRPVAQPASMAVGPWLVAAGPPARRRPAGRPASTPGQLIDGHPCPSSPAPWWPRPRWPLAGGVALLQVLLTDVPVQVVAGSEQQATGHTLHGHRWLLSQHRAPRRLHAAPAETVAQASRIDQLRACSKGASALRLAEPSGRAPGILDPQPARSVR